MYVASTIQDKLFGTTPMIGWRQELDPEVAKIDSDLTTSTSSRYFNSGQHPKLTLRNLFMIAPRFEDFVYDAWSGTGNYVIGDIVSHNDKNWKSKTGTTDTPNNNVTPVEGANWTEWTIGNQKSEWLRNKVRDYSLGVIDDWLEQKHNSKLGKSIIEERALFDGAQYLGDTIENEGKVVGFEIKTNLSMGILAKIMQIGLQFTQAGTLTVSLYHSSKSSPVQEQTFTIDEDNDAQFFDVEWDLKYLTSFDSGGTWRVEYEQSNAPGLAINKAHDWGIKPPFRTGYHYDTWKLWSEYIQFHPYRVPVAQRDDPRQREYTYTESFGMNFVVSVNCDYTDFIVRQKHLFNNAMAKGIAVRFLKDILENAENRVHGSSLEVDANQLNLDLIGNPRGRKTGLINEYEQALKAVKINTNGLCKECLPCGRRGVKYKAMM